MVATIRVLGLCVILLTSLVSAGLNNKQAAVWFAAQDFLEKAHEHLSGPFRETSDITPTKEEAERAWNYAQNEGAGPIYKNRHKDSKKSIYVLTKIPHGSELARGWGLNDETHPKNAYMFWQVKKGWSGVKHTLLATQVRSVGAPVQQRHSLSSVIEEVRNL